MIRLREDGVVRIFIMYLQRRMNIEPSEVRWRRGSSYDQDHRPFAASRVADENGSIVAVRSHLTWISLLATIVPMDGVVKQRELDELSKRTKQFRLDDRAFEAVYLLMAWRVNMRGFFVLRATVWAAVRRVCFGQIKFWIAFYVLWRKAQRSSLGSE